MFFFSFVHEFAVYRQSAFTESGVKIRGGPTHFILHDQASPPQIKEANRSCLGAMTYGQFPEVLIHKKDSNKHEVLVDMKSIWSLKWTIRSVLWKSNRPGDRHPGMCTIRHCLETA